MCGSWSLVGKSSFKYSMHKGICQTGWFSLEAMYPLLTVTAFSIVHIYSLLY